MKAVDWEALLRAGEAAAKIVHLVGELITTRRADRVVEILPTLATTLERQAAELEAMAKYGRIK